MLTQVISNSSAQVISKCNFEKWRLSHREPAHCLNGLDGLENFDGSHFLAFLVLQRQGAARLDGCDDVLDFFIDHQNENDLQGTI